MAGAFALTRACRNGARTVYRMARYDFRCESCGETAELAFPFAVRLEATLAGACEQCNGDLRRVYTAPSIAVDAATGGRTVR